MTPRPRVVVVAPETIVHALRDLMPAAEVVAAGVSELVGHVVRGPVRAVVVTGRSPDGAIDVLRTVRQTRRDISLILVTDADADASDERLRALAAGVDDALPPIPIEELAGRLTLIARKRTTPRPTRLLVGTGLELDVKRRELLRDGRWIHLRPKEAGLLELFARTPGRALTRDHILERVWGRGHSGDPRTVDVHVRWLRDKIEPEPRRPERLVTVRGVGYRLDVPV